MEISTVAVFSDDGASLREGPPVGGSGSGSGSGSEGGFAATSTSTATTSTTSAATATTTINAAGIDNDGIDDSNGDDGTRDGLPPSDSSDSERSQLDRVREKHRDVTTASMEKLETSKHYLASTSPTNNNNGGGGNIDSGSGIDIDSGSNRQDHNNHHQQQEQEEPGRAATKRLFVGEEQYSGEDVLGIEIHQPSSLSYNASMDSANFMSATSRQGDDDEEDDEDDGNGGVGGNDADRDGGGRRVESASSSSSSSLPQHERVALEGRILALEKQNATLLSQATDRNNAQEIYDMYRDPYSSTTPVTGVTAPGGGGLLYKSAGPPAVLPLTAAASTDTARTDPGSGTTWGGSGRWGGLRLSSSAPPPTSAALPPSASPLHQEEMDMQRELAALRLDNDRLTEALDEMDARRATLETSKKRLKYVLKAVEKEDKQKSDLLSTLSKELGESTAREGSLRAELDACRVRLEGFAMVSDGATSASPAAPAASASSASSATSSAGAERVGGGGGGGDLATALVVSEKQNRALQAHNEELSAQNHKLHKRVKVLEKEVAPKGDKEKQLYGRYLEMKASLSSLAGVLEEVNGQNQLLNGRVQGLEAELEENRLLLELEQGSKCIVDALGNSDDVDAERDALRSRVEELERQLVLSGQVTRSSPSSDGAAADRPEQAGRGCPTCGELKPAVQASEETAAASPNVVHMLLELDEMLSSSDSVDGDLEENTTFRTAESTLRNLQESDTMTAGEATEGPTARGHTADYSYEEGVEVTASETTDLSPSESREYVERVARLTEELNESTSKLAEARHQVSVLSSELQQANLREAELQKDRLEHDVPEIHDGLRTEIENLKLAMETAAADSNQLLGEMKGRLASTQEELRLEQSKVEALETAKVALQAEIEVLKNRQQQPQPQQPQQRQEENESNGKITGSTEETSTVQSRGLNFEPDDVLWGAENEDAHDLAIANTALKNEVAALRKDVLSSRADATKRQAKLEASLAKAIEELDIANQKVEELQADATRRRSKLESIVASAHTELSAGMFDSLSSTAGNDANELEELKKSKAAFENEVVSLRREATYRQKELEALLVTSRNDLSSERQKVQELKLSKGELDRLNEEATGLNSEGTIRGENTEALQEMKALMNTIKEELRLERKMMDELKTTNFDLHTQLDVVNASYADVQKRHGESEASLANTIEEFVVQKRQAEGFQNENKALHEKIDRLENCRMDLERNILRLEADLLLQEKKSDGLHQMTVRLQEEIDENPFEEKNVELQQKLDQLERENVAMESTVAAMNKKFDKQKETSESLEVKMVELQDKVDALENDNTTLQLAWSDTKKDLVQEKQKSADSLEKVSKLEGEIEALTREQLESSDQAKELGAMLASTSEKLLMEQQKVENLSASISSLQMEVNSQLETMLTSTKDELFAEHQKFDDLTATAAALQTEVVVLKDEVAKMTKDLIVRQEMIDDAHSELATERRKAEDLDEKNASLLDDIDALRVAMKAVRSEKSELEASLASARQEISSERDSLEEVVTSQKSLEAQVNALKGYLEKTTCEVSRANEQKEELEASLAASNNELFAAREKLESTEKVKMAMQAELDSLRHSLETTTETATLKQVELTASLAAIQQERQKVTELQASNGAFQTAIDALKSHLESTTSGAAKLSQEKTDLEDLVASTTERLETLVAKEKQKNESLNIANNALQKQSDGFKGQLESFSAEASQAKQEKSELESIVAVTNLKVNELNVIKSDLQSELDALKVTLESCYSRLIETTEQRTESDSLLTTTREILSEEQQKAAELIEANSDLNLEIDTLTKELEIKNTTIAELEDCLSDLKRDLLISKQEIQALTETNDTLKAEINSLQSHVETTDARALLVTEHKAELEILLTKTKELLDSEIRKVDYLGKSNDILSVDVQTLKGDLEKERMIAVQVHEVANRNEHLESQLSSLNEEQMNLRKKIEELKALNTSLQSELTDLKGHAKNITERSLLVNDHKSELGFLLTTTKELLDLERQKVAAINATHSTQQAELESLREEMGSATSRAGFAIKKKNELEIALSKKDQELTAEKARVDDLELTIKSLESNLESTKRSMTAEIEESSNAKIALETLLFTTEKDLTQTKDELADEKQKVQVLAASKSLLQEELEALKGVRESELSKAIENMGKLESKLIDCKEKLRNERKKAKELTQKNFGLENDLNDLRNDVNSVAEKTTAEQGDLGAQLASMNWQLLAEQQKVEELNEEKATLESRIESLQQDILNCTSKVSERNRDLEGLLAEKQKELYASEQAVLKEKEIVEAYDRQISELKHQTNELEKMKWSLDHEVETLAEQMRLSANLAADGQNQLETLLLATEVELKAERRKVEDYAKSESTMQFELDALKEAMHNTMSTDRERMLSSTRDELEAERSRAEELKRTKLALESKVRMLQQSVDGNKASAFVHQKETEMFLSSTKQELEVAERTNEELTRLVENFDVSTSQIKEAHRQELAALEKRHDELLIEHERLKENLAALSGDLVESSELNNELSNQVETMETEIESLEEEREGLLMSIKDREEAVIQLAAAKEALLGEAKKVRELENEKNVLESVLRVAKQGVEQAKATAGVRGWETEMLLANTKKDLEEAVRENEKLTGQLTSLESRLKESDATHQATLLEVEMKHNDLLNDIELAHQEGVNNVTRIHDALLKEYDELKRVLEKEIESGEGLACKVETLEGTLSSLAEEKESLLQRLDSLTQRDQILEASLTSSNDVIAKLQASVTEFQERFEYLAEQLQQAQERNNSIDADKENMLKAFEKKETNWIVDRSFLANRINALEKETTDARDAVDSVRNEYNDSVVREANLQSELVATKVELDGCREQILAEKSNFELSLAEWNSERGNLQERITEVKDEAEESIRNLEAAKAESIKQLLAEWETDRHSLNTLNKEMESEVQQANGALDAAKRECAVEKKLKEDFATELKDCQEEVRRCQTLVLDKQREMEEIKSKMDIAEKGYLQRIEGMEEDIMDFRTDLENATQDFNAGLIREQELQLKIDESNQELQACKDELLFERNEMKEVRQILFSTNADFEVCKEHLAASKLRIQELELQKNQLDAEYNSKIQNGDVLYKDAQDNKAELAVIETKLAEAKGRESLLESMLSASNEDLEAYKKQLSDAEYCNGVFKELISKLNKANDNLESKISRLSNEDAAKRSHHKDIPKLSEENDFLRSEKEKFVNEIASLGRQLQALASEKDAIQKSADELQGRVDDLQEKQAQSTQGLTLNPNDLEDTMKRINRLEDQLAKSQVAVDDVTANAKVTRQRLMEEIEAASAREAQLSKEVKSLRLRNEAMEKRLEEQEKELDEFESDFAMARDDARKVVEELRAQAQQLERRNQQLMADGSAAKAEDLKNKLRQLISQNQKLQIEVDSYKARQKNLQKQLGFGGWK